MAELYWASQRYTLSEASENIGEVYEALASAMRSHGWAGVQHSGDVHGYKPGVDLFAAVQFLPIGGFDFWSVVAVGGGNAGTEQAQQELKELQNLLADLKFF